MICPICKGNNADENQFCIYCGRDLTEENKLPYVLAVVAAAMTILSFSIAINIITVLVAISSIVLTFVKKQKKYKIRNICLSSYAIVASVVWIYFLTL